MGIRVYDTSVLIAKWRQRCYAPIQRYTAKDAVEWARELERIHGASHISTVVEIEFLAGFTNRSEMKLARLFLGHFANADEGRILKADWDKARNLAERIPRDGRPRQLGDCLLAAIARRLTLEVVTLDAGFPK